MKFPFWKICLSFCIQKKNQNKTYVVSIDNFKIFYELFLKESITFKLEFIIYTYLSGLTDFVSLM